MEAASVLPSRMDIIHNHRANGGWVAAIFPIHYPRALIRAFDILPVEVWGPPGLNSRPGAVHLQPYICSIVQNAVSFLDMGGLDITDILVVPHACDSLQGLGSILIDFILPNQPVLPFYIPRGRRASDGVFLQHELRAMYDKLAEITGRHPTNEELIASIHREEEANRLLSNLYKNRFNLPLPNEDLYRLIRSREYLPVETFTLLIEKALKLSCDEPQDGVPIIISGILPEPKILLKKLTELGFLVVGDDLACCGRRLYPPGTSQNPFSRMAERVLTGPSDPTRGDSIESRFQHIQTLVSDRRAKGVVFSVVKFCEPELFQLPILRHRLSESGIPSLLIEVDINDQTSQQVFTRLEAFWERLQ